MSTAVKTSGPESHGRDPAHLPNQPILTVQGASLRYGEIAALDTISFQLDEGDQVAVIGPNGAGKSTLFKAIAGVIPLTSGDVRIGGSQPTAHICIAYIPQRSQIDWSFPATVFDVVLMGRVGRLGWFRRPKTQDRDMAHTCLDLVRLGHLAKRQIGELSGGEQQRMFIARALAQEAELMLMDEVMTGCDTPARDEIHRILDQLRQRRVTVMVSTHDLDEAATHFPSVLLLNRQLIGFGRPEEVFVPDRLKQAYGGHLRMVETKDGVMLLSDSCCGGGEVQS